MTDMELHILNRALESSSLVGSVLRLLADALARLRFVECVCKRKVFRDWVWGLELRGWSFHICSSNIDEKVFPRFSFRNMVS